MEICREIIYADGQVYNYNGYERSANKEGCEVQLGGACFGEQQRFSFYTSTNGVATKHSLDRHQSLDSIRNFRFLDPYTKPFETRIQIIIMVQTQ